MRQEVIDYLETFTLSKPIFNMDPEGTLNLKSPAQKPSHDEDPIKRLVHEAYEERFDMGLMKYRYNRDEIQHKVDSGVRESMFNFLKQNMDTPMPHHTKLYKWLRENSGNSVVFEGMYLLYKYIAPKCNDDMRFIGDNEQDLKNVILILEAMMARYNV